MAIIYTYPLKYKPVAADLVVITDSEDRNFTKQCSIQSIIELFDCDKCTFCTTSISKINTPSGTAIEASTCDEELNFISSDGSVSIVGDNATKTIDFKASASDGCPTTYVIKPVNCDKETGDCIIEPKTQYWTYTNDCFFADYAPGYVKDLQLNGVVWSPYGTSGEVFTECYFVEEAVFTATASDCPECCDGPTDPIIKFSPCDRELSPIETAQSNITGWDAAYLDNPCIFLNINDPVSDEPRDCWLASIGTTDSGSAITINSAEVIAEPCNCNCCLYPCTFVLEPCPGDMPAVFDPYAGSAATPAVSDPCSFSDGNIVSITIDGSTWCFTLTKVCETPEYVLPFILVGDCTDEACSSEPIITYRWNKCDDAGVFFVEEIDPGVSVGTIRRYCCDPGTEGDVCYEYVGASSELPSPPPCPSPVGEDEPDCGCCEYPCNYAYTACPGDAPKDAPENIVINVGKSADDNCLCNEPADTVYITLPSGLTWCYTSPERICNEKTTTFEGPAECGGEFCPTPPEETLKFRSCGAPDWYNQDPLDPITAPFSTPGLHYIGDLAGVECVKQLCCIEVEATTDINDTLGFSTFVSVFECNDELNSTALNCECCQFYDVATYTACSEECSVEGFPTLNINVCDWGKTIGQDWKPGTGPNIIKVAIGADIECCYEYVEPACDNENFLSTAGKEYTDLSFDPAITTCEECIAEYFRYTLCSDPETELLTTSILNPGIEGLTLPFTGIVQDVTTCENQPETCCITVIASTTDIGPTTPIDCWDTAYVTEIESCECCIYKDIVAYTKCPEAECDIPAEYDTIYVDACKNWDITQASGVNPPEFVYVEYAGVSCCYERGAWTCVPETSPQPDSIIDSLEASCESCVETLQNFKITNCTDPLDVTITNQDLSANVGGGVWLGSNGICYEVDNYVGPASTPLGITLDTKYDEVPFCDCCVYRDIRTYTKCAGVGGTACDAMPATVYIDTNTVPGGPAAPATNIIISELATPTNECCYVLVEEPPCEAADTLYAYKATFETCEELPSECVESEEAPKMLITGQDGVQDGTTPIVVPDPIGEFPPYVIGGEEDSWFSVQIPEDAILPEGTQWSTMYAVEGFYVGEGPLVNIGNQAGSAFLPAFGVDTIGDLVPGAIYQLTASADFIIDPTVIDGMEGNIVFFTGPDEDVAEEKSAIAEPEGGKKTIYEEALEEEAAKKAAGEDPKK